MRVVDIAGRLLLPGVLALAGLLLNQFVRHLVTERMLDETHQKAIAAGKIAFIGTRKPTGISQICVVLQYGRVQVPVRMKAIARN